MISLKAWLRIRDWADRYFRTKALKQGQVRLTGNGGLEVDVEDITASESAKAAYRAAYFVLDKHSRPKASPDDVLLMRRSLEDSTAPTWVGYVVTSIDSRVFVELEQEACEALGWRERDRIGFRRLFSGELLTFVDRRARTEGDWR